MIVSASWSFSLFRISTEASLSCNLLVDSSMFCWAAARSAFFDSISAVLLSFKEDNSDTWSSRESILRALSDIASSVSAVRFLTWVSRAMIVSASWSFSLFRFSTKDSLVSFSWANSCILWLASPKSSWSVCFDDDSSTSCSSRDCILRAFSAFTSSVWSIRLLTLASRSLIVSVSWSFSLFRFSTEASLASFSSTIWPILCWASFKSFCSDCFDEDSSSTCASSDCIFRELSDLASSISVERLLTLDLRPSMFSFNRSFSLRRFFTKASLASFSIVVSSIFSVKKFICCW